MRLSRYCLPSSPSVALPFLPSNPTLLTRTRHHPIAEAVWSLNPFRSHRDDARMPSRRQQRRYDHLLIELDCNTGDLGVAVRLGVPRSTAAGGLRGGGAQILGAEPRGANAEDLYRKVARLEGRVRRLTAVLRIVFTLLCILKIDLGQARMNADDK